jgi:hypothetical protein
MGASSSSLSSFNSLPENHYFFSKHMSNLSYCANKVWTAFQKEKYHLGWPSIIGESANHTANTQRTTNLI